jgi:hypothetical protein
MGLPVRGAFVAFCVLGVLGVSRCVAADEPGADAKGAFERLKSLTGEWKTEAGPAGPEAKVVYRVVSGGNTVMESLFPGTSHEMVSMYFLDGGQLRMTHYCAMGNQPRMKLDAKASKPDALTFVFDGGTNLNPEKDMHMHSGRIVFIDKDHVEAEWDAYQGGKKTGTNKLVMKRP